MRQIAYSQIESLSREFSNPMWANRLMRDYVKDAIKVTTDTVRKDMILRFLRSRVGFKEVEQIAEQMVKQQKSRVGNRNDIFDIVKDLMKRKKNDAIKCVKISKQKLIKSNTCLSKTVRKGTVVREAFMEIVDMEINNEWKIGKTRTNDKVETAINKYKIKSSQVETVKGVLVGDKLLEEFEASKGVTESITKASVYCDIRLIMNKRKSSYFPQNIKSSPN